MQMLRVKPPPTSWWALDRLANVVQQVRSSHCFVLFHVDRLIVESSCVGKFLEGTTVLSELPPCRVCQEQRRPSSITPKADFTRLSVLSSTSAAASWSAPPCNEADSFDSCFASLRVEQSALASVCSVSFRMLPVSIAVLHLCFFASASLPFCLVCLLCIIASLLLCFFASLHFMLFCLFATHCSAGMLERKVARGCGWSQQRQPRIVVQPGSTRTIHDQCGVSVFRGGISIQDFR